MGWATDMLENIGNTAANTLTGGLLGGIFGKANDRRQLEQQQKLQDMQLKGQKELNAFNNAQQLQMWKDTNFPAQMAMLKEAGLSPGLIYGKGGAGSATTGSSGGSIGGGSAPSGGGELMGAAALAQQQQINAAQIKLMEAQANKTEVEAEKIGGVDTENVKADTQNKILQQVINDFAGKEAADVYNRVTAPGRAVQAKTYVDEMTARQGVAGTIYELWIEGKLKEKSLEEIESIAATNAKTRAEKRKIEDEIDLIRENTKGKRLENIITELETKLQTETGIDRNAPTWLKILGRLFVGLTSR